MSREAMLAAVRSSLTDAHPPALPEPLALAMPADIDCFVERVADYRATVRRCLAADVPAQIAELLDAAGSSRVVVPTDLPDAWVPGATVDEPLSHAELDACDAVVTAAALGIAETGTIILDAGTGQGRRAISLLPDHHICVIREDQVVQSVPQAITRLAPQRPTTFISGPSATSDIELNRVEGVHGPRRLDVIVVSVG